jgi:hypothetical protein
MVGEVFVDGQNRDVWCSSKKAITDMNMYWNVVNNNASIYATGPSCILLYYNSMVFVALESGNKCFAATSNYFFLCE